MDLIVGLVLALHRDECATGGEPSLAWWQLIPLMAKWLAEHLAANDPWRAK